MTTAITIIVGIALLAVSLAARHDNNALITFVASWTGAILVVVGLGKLIFLD